MQSDRHRISPAKNLRAARKAAGRFASRWGELYPKAADCRRQDLDSLLEFLRFHPKDRNQIRPTNAIERQLVEVRRRTRPMGVFRNWTSVERILYAVLNYENHQQGAAPVLLLTQNS